MLEKITDKICRKWLEIRMSALEIIFKRAIERYDKLSKCAFMAFSWGIDEVTDYHVLAERSYSDHNVYGTRVTWYDKS